jgi:methyltransferase (TIGR00027 family)
MRASEPSLTAHRVARRRAVHQLLDEPLVFTDPLALDILGPERARELRADPRRRETNRFAVLLRAFLAVRSRVAEDTLAELVARGLRQYVVLGAGLDTFAYRNPHRGLRVWEVDHPATQAWKRERLAAAAIAVPDPAPFVPVDFEREELGTALARSGLDPRSPVFFSWLGVTPYLHIEAIDATLGFVAGATRAGGGIVFDYGVPPSRLRLRARILFWVLTRRLKRIGEPWRTFFEPDELVEKMRTLGFATVEDLSGETLNERYFAERTDGLRVGVLGHVLRALTPL